MHTNWLTLTEAAERLGVTRAAVFVWIKKGKLPAARPGNGRMIFIKADDVEVFAAQRAAKEKK